MLEEVFALGATTAFGAFVLIFLAPIDRRRIWAHAWALDVLFSLGVILAYAGTFSGVVVAFIAGLTFSGLVRLARWWEGWKR